MTFLNGTTEISTNGDFKNIPICRNYRTNVSGNLLTKQGTFNVTIDPEFYKPDINDYPELRAALANGGSVTLSEDVTIEAPLVVETGKTVEIDLNGKDIINTTSLPDTDPRYGNTTVFEVKGGSTLNIKGDGDIKAIGTKPNEDGYRMAVYAYGDAKVNIYGGNFFNDQDYNNRNAQLDLIYADGNAVINIYGGRFESACANARGYWVLNLKDGSNAAINVYGGTFVNFDPSNSMTENPVKNFVAAGSTTVKVSATPAPNGTYEVVPAGGQTSVPVEVTNAEGLTGALSNPVIAKIAVASDIDLTSAPVEDLTFTEHKTIDIKEGATLQLSGGSNRCRKWSHADRQRYDRQQCGCLYGRSCRRFRCTRTQIFDSCYGRRSADRRRHADQRSRTPLARKFLQQCCNRLLERCEHNYPECPDHLG